VAKACVTRATAQLRASGGEVVGVRPPATWATTAVAGMVVVPSVRKEDGADLAGAGPCKFL
jgi:hypothetical protein